MSSNPSVPRSPKPAPPPAPPPPEPPLPEPLSSPDSLFISSIDIKPLSSFLRALALPVASSSELPTPPTLSANPPIPVEAEANEPVAEPPPPPLPNRPNTLLNICHNTVK